MLRREGFIYLFFLGGGGEEKANVINYQMELYESVFVSNKKQNLLVLFSQRESHYRKIMISDCLPSRCHIYIGHI